MKAPELLEQLPRWNALSAIPVLESPGMTWRDEPFMAEVQGLYSGRRNVILVGDKAFFEMRLEAHNQAREIVRTGLRDIIDWLEAAGRKVW